MATDPNNIAIEPTSAYNNSQYLQCIANSLGGSPVHTAADAAFLDYFGAGTYNTDYHLDMPKASNRVVVTIYAYHTGPTYTHYIETWAFWGVPGVDMPKALAVARANPNVLFVGLNDRIVESIDGSYSWHDEVSTEGAVDICVDPQLGGVLYYWTPAGTLHQSVGGVITSTFTLSGGRTDNEIFGRIARDFNTGKVWAIDDAGNLKQLNLGTWSTLKTGLLGAKGLRAYYASPTRLVYVDADDIHYSADAGATFTNKKGTWSTYTSPVSIHLLGTT
jgi:hypothetical protein